MTNSNAPALIPTPEILAHMVWMVQTVHQAYHEVNRRSWEHCPSDICSSTARFLSSGHSRERG